MPAHDGQDHVAEHGEHLHEDLFVVCCGRCLLLFHVVVYVCRACLLCAVPHKDLAHHAVGGVQDDGLARRVLPSSSIIVVIMINNSSMCITSTSMIIIVARVLLV